MLRFSNGTVIWWARCRARSAAASALPGRGAPMRRRYAARVFSSITRPACLGNQARGQGVIGGEGKGRGTSARGGARGGVGGGGGSARTVPRERAAGR